MQNDQLRPNDFKKALVYGMIASLTLFAFAMIKGWQLMTMVWMLLFARIAYEDFKTKSFPLYLGVAFMVFSLLLRMISGEAENTLVGVIGGTAIIGFSWILKKHIGVGDTVVMLGILLAWGAQACGTTFFLATVCGVIQCFFTFGPAKQKEVAFTPLLFMGMMVYILME